MQKELDLQTIQLLAGESILFTRYPAKSFLFQGAIQVLRNVFFWKLDPHPPPRNANNVEPYTFVTLFSGTFDNPHPICVT